MGDNIRFLSVTPRSVSPISNYNRYIKKVDIQLPKIQLLSSKSIKHTFFKPDKPQFTPINLIPPKSHLRPSHRYLSSNTKRRKLRPIKKSYFQQSFPEYT